MLQPKFIKIYKEMAEFFKQQENIFILAKGTGCFVSEFAACKFN